MNRISDKERTSSVKLGAGVVRKFGAYVLWFFLLASIFQTNGMFNRYIAQIWGSQIFAPIFAPIFGVQIFAPIFAQIFGAQIFAPIFAQIFFDVLALEK